MRLLKFSWSDAWSPKSKVHPLDFLVSKFWVLYTNGEVSLLHILSGLISDLYHRQSAGLNSVFLQVSSAPQEGVSAEGLRTYHLIARGLDYA